MATRPASFNRRFERIHDVVEPVEHYRAGGYHPVRLRDVLHSRYQIEGKFGFGLSSTVWLAQDRRLNRPVALKLLKAETTPVSQELRILQHLALRRPHEGRQHLLKALAHFYHNGPNGRHLCIVFPALPSNVADLSAQPQFRTPAFLRNIGRQMLSGLACLHDSGVIHCDLQPANLLLSLPSSCTPELYLDKPVFSAVNWLPGIDSDSSAPESLVSSQRRRAAFTCEDSALIRLVIGDFGGAVLLSDTKAVVPVTPLALRSPEIIDKRSWGTSIDIWAAACVIFELATGEPLFALSTFGVSKEEINTEHLRLIRETLDDEGLECRLRSSLTWSLEDLASFAEFLRAMLQVETQDRLSALQMLQHPWVQQQ